MILVDAIMEAGLERAKFRAIELVTCGAVRVNGDVVQDPNREIVSFPATIEIGKRRKASVNCPETI